MPSSIGLNKYFMFKYMYHALPSFTAKYVVEQKFLQNAVMKILTHTCGKTS